MNYPDKIAFVSDLTRAQFAAVTNVTAITPIEEFLQLAATYGASDFLAAAAGHIYYIEDIECNTVSAITGLPTVRIWDIAAVLNDIFGIGVSVNTLFAKGFWCSRLAHNPGTASGGSYSICFRGFDVTYT